MIWNQLGFGRREERQRLCRHCSRPFRPERIGVVCRSERCGEVEDHLGRRNPRFFFADEHGLWSRGRGGEPALDLDAPCPFCDRAGRLATVCPHCRRALGVESGEDRVIAVIGATASGKSHFLAAVLHQLLLLSADDGDSESWRVALDRQEIDRLRRRVLDPLFRDLHVLPSTVDRLDEELALPLESPDGRRVLLVFRDLGGELSSQPERLAEVAFLRYAQGVVLMVDPLAFRPDDDLPPDLRKIWRPSGQPNALETLEVYRRVLEERDRRAEEAALPVLPEQKLLALAVTKADLVLPPEHPFWSDDESPEGEAVEAWIRDHLDPRLLREAEAFAEVSHHFVSSLGYPHPPGQERLGRPPEPRRVHEPIFALLDRLTEGLAENQFPDRIGEPAAPEAPGERPERPERADRSDRTSSACETEPADWGL